MPAIFRLVVRDAESNHPSMTPSMTSMLIALITLIIVGFFLIGALYLLRSHRLSKKQLQSQSEPGHESRFHNTNSSKNSNHRRLTITASPYGRRSESVYLYNGSEKHSFISGSPSPPQSPIPEIRITFPEEEDDSGKRKSGRVVVVRISDAGGVGLEPYQDEELPPYQSARDGKFESLDLDRMGGLKELERGVRKQ